MLAVRGQLMQLFHSVRIAAAGALARALFICACIRLWHHTEFELLLYCAYTSRVRASIACLIYVVQHIYIYIRMIIWRL